MDWTLGHRPGLDGLRGIAIGLVLLLHWWPSVFPGGSIGVDLFFVLSGFLITRLLIEERERAGGIRFRSFYVRRARRLFPALAVLVAVCAASPGVGWVILYAGNVGRMVGATAGGPLEHCWSLAIEEQFYLLWPAVFVVLARFRRAPVFLAVAVVAVLLHRLTIHDTNWYRLADGTDTRADSLLIGCLLAFSMPWLGRFNWTRHAFVSAAALGCVVFCRVDLTGYGYTVIALAFAAVLLWALDADRGITARPLQLLGRLSYSLYLWHYPVTWALRGGDLHATSPVSTLLAIVLSFAIASASYVLVEARFRSGKRPPIAACRPHGGVELTGVGLATESPGAGHHNPNVRLG